MCNLNRVTLRWGTNRRFLNVDRNGEEIGHLRFNKRGRLEHYWADQLEDRELVSLLARFLQAIA